MGALCSSTFVFLWSKQWEGALLWCTNLAIVSWLSEMGLYMRWQEVEDWLFLKGQFIQIAKNMFLRTFLSWCSIMWLLVFVLCGQLYNFLLSANPRERIVLCRAPCLERKQAIITVHSVPTLKTCCTKNKMCINPQLKNDKWQVWLKATANRKWVINETVYLWSTCSCAEPQTQESEKVQKYVVKYEEYCEHIV